MKITIQKVGLILIMAVLLMTFVSTTVFADTGIIEDIKTKSEDASIETGEIVATSGKILRLIRTMAIILGTIVIAVLGVKYMMGSVEEKAEYKKSFVPLIVGIVVVMGATAIATLLFSIT